MDKLAYASVFSYSVCAAGQHRELREEQHAQTKTETEIRYVTVTREVEKLVERPVYLERCMDDDGVRILNAQILGTNSPGPGPALPEAGHPAGRDGG